MCLKTLGGKRELDLFTSSYTSLCTCYDLPEFRIQVDGAGQEHLHVSRSENRCPGGEKDLKAADISVDLQQGLHVFGERDILGDSLE